MKSAYSVTGYELKDVPENVLAAELLVRCAGLDLRDPHAERTPARFVRMLQELTTPDTEWEFTTFKSSSDEMVIVRGMEFTSVCKHHVLPIEGVCHVAYVPEGKIVGLSKIPRLVAQHAHKLQIQEEMTNDLAMELATRLEPLGVGVVIDARHACMSIRGIQSQGAMTRTASMLGCFGEHDKTAKAEFLSGIGQ